MTHPIGSSIYNQWHRPTKVKTTSFWVVKQGREDEFIRTWKNEVAEAAASLANPLWSAELLRSSLRPNVFQSIARWSSQEDIDEAVADQVVKSGRARLEELCDEVSFCDPFAWVAHIP